MGIMNRTSYYIEMKGLAQAIRRKYGIEGSRLLPSKLKEIIKSEGVGEIILYPNFKNVRGCYIVEEDGNPIIAVNKELPRDPYAFTLGHELKHHLVDRNKTNGGVITCSNKNISDMVEIGAEVFSAELLYPEQMFLHDMYDLGVLSGQCEVQHIVTLKHNTDTTLSYEGLAKRAEFLKLAPQGSLKKVKWKTIEHEMFGDPRRFRQRSSGKRAY